MPLLPREIANMRLENDSGKEGQRNTGYGREIAYPLGLAVKKEKGRKEEQRK